MLRTGSESLIICPRIRENLTMENGDAAASWKDPASYLWIMTEMQGKVANGERFPSPDSGRQLLEQMHHLVYRWAMEQWRMEKSLDAEFTNLGSWINMHATIREGLDHDIIYSTKFRMSIIPRNLLRR